MLKNPRERIDGFKKERLASLEGKTDQEKIQSLENSIQSTHFQDFMSEVDYDYCEACEELIKEIKEGKTK